MYKLDLDSNQSAVTARPPSGFRCRMPRCESNLQKDELVQPFTSKCQLNQRPDSARPQHQPRPPSMLNQRPDSARSQHQPRPPSMLNQRPDSARPQHQPRPPSIPSSRSRTGSTSLRPHSAKAAICMRPESAKERTAKSSASKEEEIPKCLEPFSPWRSQHVSSELTGLDGSIDCLVYLPSLQYVDHLPTLPPPQGPRDELEYSSVILPKELWKPKKYKSPFTKPAVDDNTCNHKTNLRLYDGDGRIVYERYQGMRTSGIVRKEIVELERLMLGLTTDGSNCLVVQLLNDINSTNKMVSETKDHASQVKSSLPQPEDDPEKQREDETGLIKFYETHDQIMEQIREEHKHCLQELSAIEASLGVPDHERRFPEPEPGEYGAETNIHSSSV